MSAPAKPLRTSLVIYLALMAYLAAVKVVIDLTSTDVVTPLQAAVFNWPVIGLLTLAGTGAVWLGPRARIPYLWDPSAPSRKWLLLAVVAGLAVGGFNLAVDAFADHARLLAEALNVPTINVPFPHSLLFYSAGAIVIESLYRLILITVPLWLIATVILRKRGYTPVFWVLAVFTSLFEPADVVTLLSGHFELMLFMAIAAFATNMFEAYLFWRHGLLAPLVFRVAFYFVWHVIGGGVLGL